MHDQAYPPGRHRLTWEADPGLSSGVYLYRLQTADGHITKKMLLVK